MNLQGLVWAAQRLAFALFVILAAYTVVGGLIAAPLLTHLFFRDWRFWRYWRQGWALWWHAMKMQPALLRWENKGFMFNVPLSSAPQRAPDPSLVRLNEAWDHGKSCGPCMGCCEKIKCPLLDAKTTLCMGYDSPFWRFFNCGRYPTNQRELEYYACPKWEMRPQYAPRPSPHPIPALEMEE